MKEILKTAFAGGINFLDQAESLSPLSLLLFRRRDPRKDRSSASNLGLIFFHRFFADYSNGQSELEMGRVLRELNYKRVSIRKLRGEEGKKGEG